MFESFAAYKGMRDEALANLRSETAHILSYCNKHDNPNAKSVTHLAFGYVQSGKTMSFTALTAMARDNGYRLIFTLLESLIISMNKHMTVCVVICLIEIRIIIV